MSDLYMRHIELIVNDRVFLGDDFTINFNIPFDDKADPNVAEINVYNLSNSSVNTFSKDSKVILNAGYKDDYGTVLIGLIKDASTEFDRVDKITTAHCLDGSDSWLNMTYSKTFAEGISASVILGAIMADTGLQIGAFNIPVDYTYSGGKTINTSLKQAIADIAADCGAKTHVTRGKIFIRPQDEGDNIGFVLDSEHGLISSPQPFEKEETDVNGNKYTRYGYKVKMLLNHLITTDAILQITSKTANGIFRVDSGRHYCNGREYYTDCEVFQA